MAQRVQGNDGTGTLTGGEYAVSRPGCFTALNRRTVDPQNLSAPFEKFTAIVSD